VVVFEWGGWHLRHSSAVQVWTTAGCLAAPAPVSASAFVLLGEEGRRKCWDVAPAGLFRPSTLPTPTLFMIMLFVVT